MRSQMIGVFLLPLVSYDRMAAAEYAERWALSRNPAFYDFSALGGDCTNFVSQCLFAGSRVMNYRRNTGWYYRSLNDRSASWTGVRILSQFLLNNPGPGPFAALVPLSKTMFGDVIQLGHADGSFYHSLFVLEVSPAAIYVAAHSQDSLWRPLSSYHYDILRVLHILGVRKR